MLGHYESLEQASLLQLRQDVDLSISQSLRRISKAGTDSCELCCEERLIILKDLFTTRSAMNFKDEIFFGCRHKPEFPRWHYKRDFTDDTALTVENT